MSTAAVVSRNGTWTKVPEFVSNVESMTASANLINLVKGAGDKLERCYPGWLWSIRPDEAGGIVDIFTLRLSGRLGYTLHTRRLQEDEDFLCVMRAGGELLERFGFRRVAYSYAEWQRREKVLGQFIPNVSDLQSHMQRSMRTQQLKQALATGHAAIATNPSIGAALSARAQAQRGA